MHRLGYIEKEYLWGTERWIVSTHPDGLSPIDDCKQKGITLRDLCGELPVLVKIIDAKQALSIQVHPNDEYARRIENESGKNEMWYVLDAEPGAEIILGFKDEYKNIGKDELSALIESGKTEKAVRRIPVRRGDCYCIPAGLIHAIGAGVKILEVQQCSNLTYRVFDYNRVDENGNTREIHVDKALDVIDAALEPIEADYDVLADWEYFKCDLITLYSDTEDCGSASFECLTVVEGRIVCKNKKVIHRLCAGDSLVLPDGKYELTGHGKAVRVRTLA